jgi:drug/metabolite transporter (DMT)-like permease
VGAIASALGASLSWGLCDFLAGLASRRTPVLTVVRISSIAGLCAIVPVVVLRGQSAPGTSFVLYGVASGTLFAASIAAFYRSLAVTQMSRVAPIVAAAPAIPAVFGQIQGDRLSAAQTSGIVLIIIGVALAAAESRSASVPSPRVAAGVGLALGATACFGVAIIALDEASAADPFWASLVVRIATTIAIVGAALALRRFVPAPRAWLPRLWLVGLLDAAGICLFAAATQKGPIGIVAATAGLVPLVIVLLAWVVLHERLRALQYAGAAAAIVGVVLVSAG